MNDSGSIASAFAQEKAYIRKIERRFLALRGSGHFLSPRDFALLLDWYHRGVPAEVVIATVESLFMRAAEPGSDAGGIQSIAYCRRAVEQAWKERRAALLAPARVPHEREGKGSFTLPEIAAHLEKTALGTIAAAEEVRAKVAGAASANAAEAVGADPTPAAGGSGRGGIEELGLRGGGGEEAATCSAGLIAIAARLRELGRALRAGETDLQALEEELIALEARALSIARPVLPDEERERLEGEARDSLSLYAARMSDRARVATLRRAVDSAIRRRFKLPRYSLFTQGARPV